MKSIIFILMISVSTNFCTAGILPLIHSRHSVKISSNVQNTSLEPYLATTEQTTELYQSTLPETTEVTTVNSNEHQAIPAKLAELPELLLPPLNMLQLLINGPHKIPPPVVTKPYKPEEPEEYVLPLQLPFPLLGLPHLISLNADQNPMLRDYDDTVPKIA